MLVARHKLRLLISIFLIIVAVITWTNIDHQENRNNNLSLKKASDIDFFVQDAEFTSFDNKGQVARTARSINIEHYPQQQFSIAKNMTINHYRDHHIQASITGHTANISELNDAVIFRKNVTLISYKKNTANSTLKTQELTYHRQQQLITSDQFVEITDTIGNTVTATGLAANINLNTIHLKQNVKGTLNAN